MPEQRHEPTLSPRRTEGSIKPAHGVVQKSCQLKVESYKIVRPGPAYKTGCHCERSAAIFHCLTFKARVTQAKAQCLQLKSADVGRFRLVDIALGLLEEIRAFAPSVSRFRRILRI